MADITSPAFRAIREQAHDDAESLVDDSRTTYTSGRQAANDQANGHGYTGVERQEYVEWFVQVWADWKRHRQCTHHG